MRSLDTLGKGAEKEGKGAEKEGIAERGKCSECACVCVHMHVHTQEARDKPFSLKSLCFTSFISSLETDYFEQR